MFASKYNPVTQIVPSASARGTVRSGSFTSPAAKVISCQESAENNEPDCETQIAANNPQAVAAVSVPATGVVSRGFQNAAKLPKFALMAACLQKMNPSTISAARAITLADVNRFCTILPYRMPSEFVQVNSAITANAVSCAVDKEIA